MFADEERDELEGATDPEPEDAQFVEPGSGGEIDALSTVPEDDTGEFVESAPPLAESVVPISTEPPAEDAVEDWVTVEMPGPKSEGPGEAPDERTPPDEITPVEELPKVPGAGVVVEPVDSAPPVPPAEQPAVEPVSAPPPQIEAEPEPASPPPDSSAPPAVEPPPAASAPPVVPPKPASEPPASPVVPARPAAPAPVPPAASAAPAAGAPPVSAVPVEQPFMGPVGRGLSGVGIRDRRAQQWVTAGLAAVLLACCTCSCMAAIALTSFTTVGG